ncbi:small integral membrane protein 5 isoform X1 [Gracilinanus agilis]|uniref:small integral membrane protein 5 isoform X1 n=1 Tax=Gracilinanus agilis TaxID=191870 RepID=UPI001CFF04A9|nr:small integral membrane protein 5 isoform X1 [Gracilinanus agilis]
MALQFTALKMRHRWRDQFCWESLEQAQLQPQREMISIAEDFILELQNASRKKLLNDPWTYGPLVVMLLFYATIISLFLFALFFNCCQSTNSPPSSNRTTSTTSIPVRTRVSKERHVSTPTQDIEGKKHFHWDAGQEGSEVKFNDLTRDIEEHKEDQEREEPPEEKSNLETSASFACQTYPVPPVDFQERHSNVGLEPCKHHLNIVLEPQPCPPCSPKLK